MTLGQIVDKMANQMEKRSRAWTNPSWWNLCITIPWLIGALFLVYWWKIDREIASREQTVQGLVVSHEPANHNRYGYTFSVNGKTFNGWETPKKNELQVCKRVVVYYDPLDPNRNALIDFGDLSLETLGPVPMLLLGIGAVALYIRNRRRRNKSAVPYLILH